MLSSYIFAALANHAFVECKLQSLEDSGLLQMRTFQALEEDDTREISVNQPLEDSDAMNPIFRNFSRSPFKNRCRQKYKNSWTKEQIEAVNAEINGNNITNPSGAIFDSGRLMIKTGNKPAKERDFNFAKLFTQRNSYSLCATLGKKLKPEDCATICAHIPECDAFGSFYNTTDEYSQCCLNTFLKSTKSESGSVWYQGVTKNKYACWKKTTTTTTVTSTPCGEACEAQKGWQERPGNCRSFMLTHKTCEWKHRQGAKPSGMISCERSISRGQCRDKCLALGKKLYCVRLSDAI